MSIFRSVFNNLYEISDEPKLLEIKSMSAVIVDIDVHPESKEIWNAIKILVDLSNAIKKSTNESIDFPLEGVWGVIDSSRSFVKENIIGKVMMRQPDNITQEIFNQLKNDLIARADNDLKKVYDKAKLISINDGKTVQILHKGHYDDELRSFKKIDDFLTKNNLKRKFKTHREIYLVDTTKTKNVDDYLTVLSVIVE